MSRRGDVSRSARAAMLRGSIFLQLRDDILKGRYEPGENLVELKLAAQYGVSRTPVREALRQLELEGLVKYLPNRGVAVEGITTEDVKDIFAIREHLESLVANWAARKAEPEEVKKMEDTLDLQEFYTAKDDVEQVTVLDTEFHRLLLEASRSKSLRYALGSMLDYVEQARLRSLHVPGRIHDSIGEHRAILEAVAAGNAELAGERMAEHMRRARENVLQHVATEAKEDKIEAD